ncbi:hypothetical protein [Variovorax boronicumulans]|uniref:hypothetical protein n=1 Tax=Variovorax boronicumulans TaxID=436515 RepID=UPI00339B1FED
MRENTRTHAFKGVGCAARSANGRRGHRCRRDSLGWLRFCRIRKRAHAGGCPLASHLLPEFEQLFCRQTSASGGLLATDFLALGRAVRGHRLAHFTSADLADPQETTRHSPARAAGARNQQWQRKKVRSH